MRIAPLFLTAAVAAALVFTAGCAGKPEVARTAKTAPTPPEDESRHFPLTGLLHIGVVSNHLLEKSFMPGGNVADYKRGKVTYQAFIGKMPDAQQASFLLLDWHKSLTNSKYLPQMGGYYGMDGTRPVYVFVKGAWVAGITGLREAEADPLARELAAHL